MTSHLDPRSYAAQGKQLPTPADADPAANMPRRARAWVNQTYEPQNVSSTATVSTVQAAIRAAEAGNTRDLFALYRDLMVAGSHAQTEFSKRKLAVLSQPVAILPVDKENPDDVLAAEVCRCAMEDCENFDDGLTHLLDSCLWPVSVVQKVFKDTKLKTTETKDEDPNTKHQTPNTKEQGTQKARDVMRYTLCRLEPVNHTLLCFYPRTGATAEAFAGEDRQLLWEPDLRLWPTSDAGDILFSEEAAYHVTRDEHMVHRGHLLTSVRDNWGGPMRAVVFWWLMGALGRDWFARYMERFGAPWPLAKTDAQNQAAVDFLKSALSLSTKVGGLVVDHETEVELVQAVTAGAADAYERFLNVCNREQSKVILGQTLSGTADPSGMNSGNADLHGEVRDDVRQFDQKKLGGTLRKQLFEPLLRFNGLRGSAPNIVWGGLSAADAKELGALLVDLSNAQLEPADEAIPTISERVGFEVQRKQGSGVGGLESGSFFTGGERKKREDGLEALSMGLGERGRAGKGDLVDRFAAEGAAEIAEAFRLEFEEVRTLAADSGSAAEFLMRLQHRLPHMAPGRILKVMEPVLQKCAAAGAVAGKR
jgi:hypothetical protein